MGFVTSGGYSLKEGQSIAKGWILGADSQTRQVFIKNPRGRKGVEGVVQIIENMKGTKM